MSSSRKPVIGIISCNRIVEGESAYTVKNRYVDAVARYADAVPLICPSLEDSSNAALVVERLDAILLTGSNSNIAPRRYGARDGRGPYDANRDGMSAALIAAATVVGKPVFGICRGLQEINVALGGTLQDHRDGGEHGFPHHAPDDAGLDDMFAFGHRVEAVPGSLLADIVGSEPIAVNSVHYQAIGTLAPGLIANAKASDGVIEAISSSPGASPILAVQWHPEWRPDDRPHDLAFWREIGRIARKSTVR